MGPFTREPNQAAVYSTSVSYSSRMLARTRTTVHTQQERRHKPTLEATIRMHTRETSGEGFHGDDARDNTLVVAKKQTSKG